MALKISFQKLLKWLSDFDNTQVSYPYASSGPAVLGTENTDAGQLA
jgi:hypothetical protein